MIYPKFVKENNIIGVPAPSAGADDELKINKFKNAKKKFEELGYKVQLSQNIYKCEKQRSASEKERGEEINSMFADENIDMMICVSGGEFLIEILPYVNFDLIRDNPKFICGFSDPTGLLYPITTKYDIATIYGKNFGNFGMEPLHKSENDFLEIIKGNIIDQKNYEMFENERGEKVTGLESYNLTDKVYWNTINNKPISISGRIIGGCFDLISELAGTKYDGINEFNEKYKDDGIIWYFDNCEISMEETIRTLWKMNELGYFKYTKAVIFGRFGVEVSNSDYDVKSCLEDSVLNKLNIPIIYNADISHKGPSLTIINGAIVTVDVNDGKANISFKLK